MSLREQLETILVRHAQELTEFEDFAAPDRRGLARGLRSVHRADRATTSAPRRSWPSSMRSPPPEAAANLAHNMLEEMGIEEESGVAHPALLRVLVEGAGLGEQLAEMERLGRTMCARPSRTPSSTEPSRRWASPPSWRWWPSSTCCPGWPARIGAALARHRGLSPASLEWFTHHSEVDIQHAEQGLDKTSWPTPLLRVRGPGRPGHLRRDPARNVFVKRYFGELALARLTRQPS